jgi:hypothetical protein
MTRFNRRGFLKTGITGAAGIMAFSPVLGSKDAPRQNKKIEYRTLGKTGMSVLV